MMFDNILVVDWSGGNDRGPKPKKDAIWAALIEQGTARPSQYFRNRAEVEAYLLALFTEKRDAGQTLLAGFDFPFGYAGGFAEKITGSSDPLRLWDYYAENLLDTPKKNNRFALANSLNQHFPGTGPFWFNASRKDLPDLPHKGRDRHGHGLPEKRLCESLAKGAFSCWQLGGAGAVGSQAITGMASLSRLRARLPGQISVWPFEPLTTPIALVEVWPSLHAAQIRAAMQEGDIKDEVQVRITAANIAAAQTAGTLCAALATVPKSARQSEGWILGLQP